METIENCCLLKYNTTNSGKKKYRDAFALAVYFFV